MSIALALMSLLIGGLVSWQTLLTNSRASLQVAQLKSEAAAVEKPRSASSKGQTSKRPGPYSVAADLPKYISIPKIGVTDAKVIQVGLTSTGAVGTPVTGSETAWYSGSDKPGTQNGATFIDGHVLPDANGATAVFGRLHELVVGDALTITKGDDTKLTYKVVRSADVPLAKVDMSELLTPVEVGASGLNLMTCAGNYDSKTNSMDRRIEVFAVLVGTQRGEGRAR